MSKEFKVGLLTIISCFVLYFGFNFLKGKNVFTSKHHYYVIYDNVGGLQNSNPVIVNGLTVGRVQEITILQDAGNKMLVEIEVVPEIKVGEGSKAVLKDAGMLGGKVIDLILSGRRVLEEGDTLVADTEKGMMADMSEKVAPIMESADSIMLNLNNMLKEYTGMGENVKTLIGNASNAAGSANALLAQNKQKINSIMTNFEKISSDLSVMQQKLNPVLDKMNAVADSLGEVEINAIANEMKATMSETKKLMAGLNSGEGTMGKLMKDEAMYKNINKTMTDVDALILDLKENPNKYVHFSVFGKKEKKGDTEEKKD
ncbi:MAG: phospholipid/cholesterol/gamma-HCH transport system substrate-binding protein [Arenicella sp.]|jgi:phospholipid/cholesterol/gamma-HCH transport system substrate-binding protein